MSRQQILVDYENLSYILRTIEDEHSSVCDTEAYRYMRAQLKANKENSFLKKLRAIIKADPTPANVQRWYQMHARTGYAHLHRGVDRETFEYYCRANTFRRWKGVDMDPLFIEYKSEHELDAIGTTLLKLIDEMDRQVREKSASNRTSRVFGDVRRMQNKERGDSVPEAGIARPSSEQISSEGVADVILQIVP